VAPRTERTARRERAERAVRNRERLQAYEASKSKAEPTDKAPHEPGPAIGAGDTEDKTRTDTLPAKLNTSRLGQRNQGISRYMRH